MHRRLIPNIWFNQWWIGDLVSEQQEEERCISPRHITRYDKLPFQRFPFVTLYKTKKGERKKLSRLLLMSSRVYFLYRMARSGFPPPNSCISCLFPFFMLQSLLFRSEWLGRAVFSILFYFNENNTHAHLFYSSMGGFTFRAGGGRVSIYKCLPCISSRFEVDIDS